MKAPIRLTDVVSQPIYDTVSIPAAGATRLAFFAVPLGQGTAAFGAGTKNLRDTNMELAGQLAAGFAFKLLAFRLAFGWNVATADFQIAINAAVFRFFVAAKEFLRVPATSIPAGNGPFFSGIIIAASQVAAANAFPTNGWPSMQNSFSIGRKPLDLGPGENFSATLEWQGGVQAISAITPVTIYLDGFMGRPVQ